jgi:DNA topoisomerase-2
MHLFNAQDKLKKYDKVEQIIDDYFETRLQMYQQRKEAMIQGLQKELVLLSNKAKFVQENLAGIVDLRKKKKEEVTALLLARGYAVLDEDSEFKYLTKMPMDSVTEENVAKLLKDCDTKKSELEVIVNTTIHQMWLSELETLREEYMVYKEERERATYGSSKSGKMNVTGKVKKVVKK